MKNIICVLLFLSINNNAVAHYQVEDVKTSNEELKFTLKHYYLSGHHTNHMNTCSAKGYNVLRKCDLNYEVSTANNKIIQRGSINLKGDNNVNNKLMAAATHYDALKVAESNGTNLTMEVKIPRDKITELTGGDNIYTVRTSSAGQICNRYNCINTYDGKYLEHKLDFNKNKGLQVSCKFTKKSVNIYLDENGENIYLFNNVTNKKVVPYKMINNKVEVDCVNWLSNKTSKEIKFIYNETEKKANDGATSIACNLYADVNGSIKPQGVSKKYEINGFSTKKEIFEIPNLFVGFYVSTPSNQAQTNLSFNCDFPLSLEIK